MSIAIPSGRVVAHFSCGAASAVATKLALRKYGAAVEIYYSDTGAEHPDNARFLAECEAWFGQKVTVLRSAKYRDIWEVFEDRRFLVSHKGAPCTSEMKRFPGETVEQWGDTEIYGYTASEKHRVDNWKEMHPEKIIECPLIDSLLTKEDCFGIVDAAGIGLPVMYRLGFRNNNCIGCVKARDNLDYWRRVRLHFPKVFDRMAGMERRFGSTINRVTEGGVRREIFLDEIPPGEPRGPDLNIQCGLFCMAESANLDGEGVGK